MQMSKAGFPVFLKKTKNMNTHTQKIIILKHRHTSLNPQQGYQR